MIVDFLILGKLIGAGLATIFLVGAGVGIGVIFAVFLNTLTRNPKDEKKLLTYILLGFALTEAIALFGLMVTFLILFGFNWNSLCFVYILFWIFFVILLKKALLFIIILDIVLNYYFLQND